MSSKSLWPTDLNPCKNPSKHHREAYWNVGGKTTKLCCDCLFEAESDKNGTPTERRFAALATFKSDPDGAICS